MSLYRGFITVGGLTALSRVFGFVRDMLLAIVMGAGWVTDAFVVCFKLPNLFRSLFAEGTFNTAFVPMFTKIMREEGEDSARNFSEQALAVLLAGVLVLTIVAEIFMPYLVWGLAIGFKGAKYDLAVLLTRITFPYLACMAFVALLSAILNALGKFSAPAATPIVLNLVLIVVTLIAAGAGFYAQVEAGIIQAWGVTIAGFAQLVFVAYAARGIGMDLRFVRPRLTPAINQLLLLAVPSVITGGINQVNLFIGNTIATLQEGAVTYLYFADRINQLPLAMVGIAIGIVLLPTLTRQLAAHDEAGALASQNSSLEFALLLTLPATAALIIIPHPIIQVLYQHGSFSAEATDQVSLALAAYALGLPAYVMNRVFLPGFFAREDTKTPMRFAGISVAVNIAGSLALFPFLGHVGIALATSLSGWTNALQLMFSLMRRGHFRFDAALLRRVPLLAVASIMMGAALYWANLALAHYFEHGQGQLMHVAALGALVVAGVLCYGLAAVLTRAVRISTLRRAFSRA